MAKHEYKVIVRDDVPDFESERRYVMTEREYARHKGEKAWGGFGLTGWVVGLGPTRKDWHRYLRALESYDHAMERYRGEIEDDGIIPCFIRVEHHGSTPDHRIKVKIRVENGIFHVKKKAPERPNRIDGAPDYHPNQPQFSLYHGFVRRNIEMGRNTVESEFSRLGRKDSALVVNQVLHLAYAPETRIYYQICSDEIPDGVVGEAKL